MATDPIGDLNRAMDLITFLDIVREESKRIIVCAPGLVEGIRQIIAEHGASDVYTVQGSTLIPDDSKLYVIDQNSLDAAMHEALQCDPVIRGWRERIGRMLEDGE